MSLHVVSGATKWAEILFRLGLCPVPSWGAHSAPPDPAALRRLTCKGREHRGKRKRQKERERRQDR